MISPFLLWSRLIWGRLPVIPIDVSIKASKSFFMTGMTTEWTEDTFAQQFRDFLKPVDRETVTEIKLHKTDWPLFIVKHGKTAIG